MEDKLGPGARLVDFLLGCTLDSGLKMHFQIQSTSVHVYKGGFQTNWSPRSVTATRIEERTSLVGICKGDRVISPLDLGR